MISVISTPKLLALLMIMTYSAYLLTYLLSLIDDWID